MKINGWKDIVASFGRGLFFENSPILFQWVSERFHFSLQNQVRYTFSHYMIFLTLDYIRWIKERNNTCIFQKIWRIRNLCHSVNWLVAKNSGQVNAWRNSASQSPLFYLFTPLTKLHHWYASRLTIMGFFYRLPFVCFNVKIKHNNYSIIMRLYL